MREPLTVRTVTVFFLPLILMMELHQVSHSVVQAFLARLNHPLLTLAAFSIAYTFNNMISCVTQSSIQAGISFIRDRNSLWRLLSFYALVAFLPFALLQAAALTRLGEIIFGELMGASAEVVSEAGTASAILAIWIYPILIRNIAFSLAFIEKRTILITYATVVRLVALLALLLIFPFWLDGAAIGSAALTGCMTAEAAFMVAATYPFYAKLPPGGRTPVAYLEMWRFSWPLMIAQITENGVPFIINLFLGQLSSPDLAIAAYGVAYAIVRAILAPLKNLVQTAQTLLKNREDLAALLKFTAGLQMIFVGIIFALFYTPLRVSFLEGLMGLDPSFSSYVTPGLRVTFVVAVFWGFSSLFRGLLSAMRLTFAIAVTAMVRLAVIAAVGSLVFFWPQLNGTLLGIVAMGSAFMAESLVLGWNLYARFKQPEPRLAASKSGEEVA